jgi:Arc/MetJ-type ribon-helix-helix transcriptional regulator
MELRLTPDQQAMIREGIESGRLQKAEDAFEQAMSLWEERERRRIEIMLAVNTSEASLASGEGRTISSREQATELAESIKRRGLERRAAAKSQG